MRAAVGHPSLVQWGLSLSEGCESNGVSLNGVPGSINMRGMVIDMNDEQLKTLADLQGFLDGTVMMDFAVAGEER